MRMRSSARTSTGFGSYFSHGVPNIMCMKLAGWERSLRGARKGHRRARWWAWSATYAGIAVDIGDGRLAGRRGHEAGVEGEHPRLGVELADVDHVRADRTRVDRQVDSLAGDRKRGIALSVHL